MKDNFLGMIKTLKKEEIINLFKIYNFYPDNEKEEFKTFKENLTSKFSTWISNVSYYNSKLKKEKLLELLTNQILKKL